MKARSHFNVACAIGLLAGAVFVAGSVGAADLPKEGTYDYTSCWSGQVNTQYEFSKTIVAGTFEMMGANRSNPPGGFGDRTSFRCTGIFTRFEGKNTGSNVCELIDSDGDRRLSQLSWGSDGKTTKVIIAGTGKYEGSVESGTVTPLGPFPSIKPGAFQDCNHQTGTYKLK
jgi:hypothetical protein